MSSRLDELAARRAALIARSDEERVALSAAFGGIERRFTIAEMLVSTARRMNRHRALAGAVAAGAIVAPLTAKTWLKRATWILPLAIEGYRLVRALDARRRTEPAAD